MRTFAFLYEELEANAAESCRTTVGGTNQDPSPCVMSTVAVLSDASCITDFVSQ